MENILKNPYLGLTSGFGWNTELIPTQTKLHKAKRTISCFVSWFFSHSFQDLINSIFFLREEFVFKSGVLKWNNLEPLEEESNNSAATEIGKSFFFLIELFVALTGGVGTQKGCLQLLTCGSPSLWQSDDTFIGGCISHILSISQLFTIWFITVASLQLWSGHKMVLVDNNMQNCAKGAQHWEDWDLLA